MTIDNSTVYRSRLYANRASLFSHSYQISDRKGTLIYSIKRFRKLHNAPANIGGYKIENHISRKLVYYVDNLIPNMSFPNGFYSSNWEPLAICNKTFIEDVPVDNKERDSLINSIDGVSDTARQTLDSYTSFKGFYKQDEKYPGETLRSVIIPRGESPFIICDFPENWTCNRVVIIRDYEGHKVLHAIRNSNRSWFSSISIRVSERIIKTDAAAVLLFSALRTLDSTRPELDN